MAFLPLLQASIVLAVLAGLFPTGIVHRQLDKANGLPSARFWSAVANDEKQPIWRRSAAIYMLFGKHVEREMTLAELAEILDKPTWLKEEDVSLIFKIAGWVPPEVLRFNEDETLFCIIVFSDWKNIERHNKQCLAVYMSVSGQLSKKDFVSDLLSPLGNTSKDRLVKAWAISPTWAEYDLPFCAQAIPAQKKGVSKEEQSTRLLEQIQVGMSEDEVKAILGCPNGVVGFGVAESIMFYDEYNIRIGTHFCTVDWKSNKTAD